MPSMFVLLPFLLALPQEPDRVPPGPYDRVIELEITDDDPQLVDGWGPTVAVEYEVEFEGALCLWTESELDLALRIDDPSTGELRVADDDSGRGTRPFLSLEVASGEFLPILVGSTDRSSRGSLVLHAIATPESEATREVARNVQRVAEEAWSWHHSSGARAEELCSLDLSQCDLAVLSACETNVGIRRAGQGIQSLQAALYAAGAKSSITSLWKVDDAATRKLMEFFYTSLWVEEMGKADALWQAKVAMREAGHPVRDWAGWVLTGDPD